MYTQGVILATLLGIVRNLIAIRMPNTHTFINIHMVIPIVPSVILTLVLYILHTSILSIDSIILVTPWYDTVCITMVLP